MYSGLQHYGLIAKGNVKRESTMTNAKERDRDFLMSYVESRAIPWEFQFQNVMYTMTCTMDTVLMTVFILRHQNFITQNALKRVTSPIAKKVKLIDSCDHIKARNTFVDSNLNCKTQRFYKAEKGDNPSSVQLHSMMSPVTPPCFN